MSDARAVVKADEKAAPSALEKKLAEVKKAEEAKEEKKVDEKKPEEKKAEEKEPERFCEETLTELRHSIASIREPWVSYSLAVRIEMIFSQALIFQILDQVDDYDASAGQLIKFIEQRFTALRDTAAWGPYNYDSKINQAVLKIAEKFLLFDSKQRTMHQVVKFNTECTQSAEKILAGAKPPVQPDEIIYKFMVDSFFKNQAIEHAWSLIDKKMKDAGSEKDAWLVLSSNTLCHIPTRQIFIKMMANQVRPLEWPDFFAVIQKNNHLFRLMLNVDIKHWHDVHEKRETKDKLEENFYKDVYNDADKKLRDQTSWPEDWKLFKVTKYGPEGSQFKAEISEHHGCTSQREVLAFAFALIETYRRVRAYFPEQRGYGGATKADKEVVCTVLLAFCMQAESFNKIDLDKFIEKHQSGKLTPEKKQQYDRAMEGILKLLVDTLFDISAKVVDKPKPSV